MFRVQQSPAFWATVEVQITPEEGGNPKKYTFDVRFPRLTAEEFKKLNEQVLKLGLVDDQVATALLTGEWKKFAYDPESEEAKAIVPGAWKGVVDVEDKPLELSAGNIERLLLNIGVGTCISTTFYKHAERALAKN